MSASNNAKRVKKTGTTPRTRDFDGKYHRYEYENSDEEKEDLPVAQKFIELMGTTKSSAEKLKEWQKFRRTLDNSSTWSSNPQSMLEPENDDDDGEELSEGEIEFQRRQTEYDTAYVIQNGNTVAYSKQHGRFEDLSEKSELAAKTAPFSIPLACDNEFDNFLCLSNWHEIRQFNNDDRNLAEFSILNNILFRCMKRQKDLAIKQVKGAMGNVEQQTFFGEPLEPDMDVVVLVNEQVRLVLIFQNNILMNFCLKKPNFGLD